MILFYSNLIDNGTELSFECTIEQPKEYEYYENEFLENESTILELECGAPGQYTFKKLGEKMETIHKDGLIKKMLLENGYGQNIEDGALVEVHYNAFWEDENVSFDSSHFRGEPKKFIIGEGMVLPGLEESVKSMIQGDQARFLISYKLLFGEIGCPPRIKPKADGLFNIEVMRVISSYKVTEVDKQNEESEESSFASIYKCAKSLHVDALDAFKHHNLQAAVKYFHKAVNILETSRQSCEEEQNEQQKLLLKLYTNLAVCYNKQNNPRKACCMCNEIKRISNINENCKALYHFGIALQSIGEYDRAKNMLCKAYKLKPDNTYVSKRLVELETLIDNRNRTEKEMCTRMFNMSLPSNEEEEKILDISNEFKSEIVDILREFNESQMSELKFPVQLTYIEIKFIKNVMNHKKYNMSMCKTANGYCIKKRLGFY